jgi:hypothetical protein
MMNASRIEHREHGTDSNRCCHYWGPFKELLVEATLLINFTYVKRDLVLIA